ncbi:hypothetical protein GQ600_6521 [Phytophthora cactorum]|nr:hypothetical protein GQ600_6521 [Phytophthora cactorum]
MHNKVKPFVPHQYASVPIYAAPTDEEERMANEAKQARRKASAQKNKKCIDAAEAKDTPTKPPEGQPTENHDNTK